MMDDNITYFTLPSGMRAVCIHRPGAVVGHCGVVVNAGSRDETSEVEGVAHFVEHTIFKGTQRRRGWHILNRMEAVGGELNAYTTKEETVVYSTYPAGNTLRAFDLIADLVENSIFPEGELEKERAVVEDEIDTYLDIPQDGIFDDYDELAFRGSPLAHSILGSRESLARLTSDVCRHWIEECYTPSRMVLFCSGPDAPEEVSRTASRCFSTLTRAGKPLHRSLPAPVDTFTEQIDRHTHQAHTLMGARTGGLASPDRHALALLTNIIGGPGMNSILNVALRERRGLVYSIDASTSLMTDCGLFTIYFGCDPSDVNRCVRVVSQTLAEMSTDSLTPRRLDAAKRQYLGQMTVSSVNTEQEILSVARATLHRGRALTHKEIRDSILDVTSSDITVAASRLVMSRLTES
ncbi:MAG: insulinase family protein [Muribaculaceae bacterium]|nr:insulinase family protein [Muribaculaceae bacterium]